MVRESICLKWNEFQNNIVSSFHDIRLSADFSDVTLVCEEEQQIEAHRIILSSSSPFFHRILKKNKNSHPMIYMKGLTSRNLVAIMEFIYNGEVNIFQEDLDVFLSLSADLQLKGLRGNYEEKFLNRQDEGYFENIKKPLLKSYKTKKKVASLEEELPSRPSEDQNVIQEAENIHFEFENVSNSGDLKELIGTMVKRMDKGAGWICKVCGKTGARQRLISDHIESNHISGFIHTCNNCGKLNKSRDALRRHNFRYHKV